jgi:YD repeat-containing protein
MGGVTQTSYDAQGNAIARQTGGYTAPSLQGDVYVGQVSDVGASIYWSTDRAADASVFVRPAGSSGAWQRFDAAEGFTLDHSVAITGLAPQSSYEYYIVSNDAFGYRLSSQSQPKTLRTSVGIGEVAVDGVRPVGYYGGFEANVHFSVPAGATNVLVTVLNSNPGDPSIQWTNSYSALLQSDGSYSAAVAAASADAQFRLQWADGTGAIHETSAAPLMQQVNTGHSDITLQAQPQAAGSNRFALVVGWDLSELLGSRIIASSQVAGEPERYSVFIGLSGSAGELPAYTQATLVDGRFVAQFNNLADGLPAGARLVHLRYVKLDGQIVDASPLPVGTLAGLNRHVQSLDFAFPNTDTTNATLTVRTRAAGSNAAWTELPASALHGLSADMSSLAASGVARYEYEATLTHANGQTVRQTSGTFAFNEPVADGGFIDAAILGGRARYQLSDQQLTLLDFSELAADESIEFTVTDAQGNAVPGATLVEGRLDVAALPPGRYTVHAVKKVTTTYEDETDTGPVTVTDVRTVSDISGSFVVGALELGSVESTSLQGTRSLRTFDYSAEHSDPVSITAGGAGSADHSWNYFDANGRRIFSNENGGVWTRYVYDARGNLTEEVRFQRRDASGAFVDRITDYRDRLSLATLNADYTAALAGGGTRFRRTTRIYDANNQLLSETEHSTTYGAVTHRSAHDHFGNKLVDVQAQGRAGLENAMRLRYDAANRVVRAESGAFEHRDEAGNVVTRGAVQTYTYDRRGNQSTTTDARGFTTRQHYDSYNRLATQWDGAKDGQVSTLRTERRYDAFDRLTSTTQYDLTGRSSVGQQTTTYTWTHFDQLAKFTDALGRVTERKYDDNGNLLSEKDPAGYTERFGYDRENRVSERTDRLNRTWRTTHDAYGQRQSETDGAGRVTRWQLGAFGQILGTTTDFSYYGYKYAAGAQSSSETQVQDWLGRLTDISDSFGKNIRYSYNDADQQVRIEDRALNKAVDYGYDALDRRTTEKLSKNGLVQRTQTSRYNNQGWLTGVSGNATFDAGDGSVLSQRLDTAYAFDANGNRVRMRTEGGTEAVYRYDASSRMLQGRDDNIGQGTANADQVVNELAYDGYGNRVLDKRGATSTTYRYDAGNRVVASTSGTTSVATSGDGWWKLLATSLASASANSKTEAWGYDAAGNTNYEKNRDGSTTNTTYDAEHRATLITSTDDDGKRTITKNTYDGAGNLVNTRVDGDGYGFDEVTKRDVRYLEQSKTIANSFARGARGLSGTSRYTYDPNGNLALLDRGRGNGSENKVSAYEYDLEGQIIGRADKASALTSAAFFQGYASDPEAPGAETWSDNGWGGSSAGPSVMDELRASYGGPGTQLQSYLYANNKSVAQAQGTQTIRLVKLTLTGSTPIYGAPVTDSEGNTSTPITGWRLTLGAGDLVSSAGVVNRASTARRIAQLHYSGFSSLNAGAQARVVAYIQSQLPATIAAGAALTLHNFIVLAQATMSAVTQITDYSIRTLGADGGPAGAVQSHTVRAGESLQSIAQTYFGSASYWYLIADANGLQGMETLVEGTTITIPNRVANSANSAETFKVYNESEIIGSTSPELRTIKKKKKWWQKLIQIIIVVIMIYVAVISGGAAAAAYTSVAGSVGGTLGVVAGATAAAATGAVYMAAASVVTQGVAIAAKLQDEFSWNQVGKAAVGGAFGGLASAAGAAFNAAGQAATTGGTAAATTSATTSSVNWWNVGTRVGVEGARQYVQDGKITSVAGLVGAALQGGALNGVGSASAFSGAAGWITNNARTVGAGLALLESKVRGNGDNAMHWVSLATSALFDSGHFGSTAITTDAGRINWQYVAVQAIGAGIVGQSRGEDAGLNYFGNAIGDGIVGAMQSSPASAYDHRNGSDIDSDNVTATRTMREFYGHDGSGSMANAYDRARGADQDDFADLDNTPLPRTADGRVILPSGRIVRPSVSVSAVEPAPDFAADTAARRGAISFREATARASLGAATADDLQILGQFPVSQRIDSRVPVWGPSALARADGSPATYSFNERTGQAYWNLGEDNLLREIPKAFKQPGLQDAAFADLNNPFTRGPRLGTVLRDFTIYSGVGAAVLPASVPVSAGYFGIGAVAGGVTNYSFQRALGSEVKPGDVVNATITGGLTFGKGIVPSLLVNSFGAFTTASIQGDDATVKTLAAAGGTLLGGPAGQAAQNFTRNAAVATAIRYETPTLSSSIANSILPSNALASSILQESTGASVDWLMPQERKPK